METSGETIPGAGSQRAELDSAVDLVRRASGGDQAAWEVLVRQHQEPVFRLAYLFLGDPAEAEDVAQESFLRAYLALERFDISRPLRPWLLSIAANQARNRQRSLGRFFKAWQRLVNERPGFHKDEVNGEERRWQSQELVSAVRRLGQNEQQIIYLRYFLDLSVEETAQALEVAQGTVKSRLHRALQRLRQMIDQFKVNQHDAVWAEGPHALLLTNGEIEWRRFVSGHVLIWEENDVTYRLESGLSLDEVIRVAESLAPIP